MKISLQLSYDYIQELRLAHAISESEYELCIPKKDIIKFDKLRTFFNMEYTITDEKVPIIDVIEIVHREESPKTSIGTIARPLIFPKAILEYCRSQWPDKRKTDFGFIGLVTDSRKKWLSEFLSAKLKSYKNYSNKLKLDLAIHNLKTKLGIAKGSVMVTASLKGRDFPGKSWDEDYYRYMSMSKFALCPSGDAGCPWTYRFFEAMLCGSIPVVEAVSKSYGPFKFFTSDTPVEEMVWTEEIAEHNFNQCLKNLTIPVEELNAELAVLISKNNK